MSKTKCYGLLVISALALFTVISPDGALGKKDPPPKDVPFYSVVSLDATAPQIAVPIVNHVDELAVITLEGYTFEESYAGDVQIFVPAMEQNTLEASAVVIGDRRDRWRMQNLSLIKNFNYSSTITKSVTSDFRPPHCLVQRC